MLLSLNELIRSSRIKYDLFLFDFDGVILESVEARNQAFQELFNDYSEDVCNQVLELHKSNPGLDRKDKILRCYQEIIHVLPHSNELDYRVERFGDLALRKVLGCPVVDGVLDFIELLDKNSCYVISAARQDEIRYIVKKRGLSNFFADIFGGPEKKEELISAVLKNRNVIPESAIFIGDKKNDWLAAQKTNVNFYGRVFDRKINPFPENTSIFRDFISF